MKPDPKKAQQEKLKLYITIGLVVVFIGIFSKNVIFDLMIKKKAPPAQAVSNSNAASSESLAQDLVFITSLRAKDKQYADQLSVWEKEWGRDPFVPQATVASIVKAVNLTLKGILWDAKVPKAIVNEKTLVEGDTIYGYTVVSIKQRSVILKTGEKNIELFVFNRAQLDPAGTV